jgi:hypothetical protein
MVGTNKKDSGNIPLPILVVGRSATTLAIAFMLLVFPTNNN